MAWPPPGPPSGRDNTTPMAGNHPDDHNVIANAIALLKSTTVPRYGSLATLTSEWTNPPQGALAIVTQASPLPPALYMAEGSPPTWKMERAATAIGNTWPALRPEVAGTPFTPGLNRLIVLAGNGTATTDAGGFFIHWFSQQLAGGVIMGLFTGGQPTYPIILITTDQTAQLNKDYIGVYAKNLNGTVTASATIRYNFLILGW